MASPFRWPTSPVWRREDNFNFGETKHEMFGLDQQTHIPRFALDSISFGIHDGTNSHLDALCHYRLQGNGSHGPGYSLAASWWTSRCFAVLNISSPARRFILPI